MSMPKNFQAQGRLKRGERNRTEAAYEKFLTEQKALGLIHDFWFEAIKLRLGDGANAFCTVDFAILTAKGTLELHDVKGSRDWGVTDTAMLRYKIARSTFPFDIFLVWPRPKKDGGGWCMEEI